MKVYEGAKKLEISSKELIKMIDRSEVDHHADKIPEDLLEELGLVEKKISEAQPEPTETADSAEAIVVEEEDDFPVLEISEDGELCPYTPAQIELGIRCLGSGSPCYKWKHLSAKR